MVTGLKVFVLEYWPGAGGRGVAKKRLTLGRYGAVTVDQARKAAVTALAASGAEKSRQRGALSVAELVSALIEGHVAAKLKRGTAIGYKITLGKLRRAYGGVKAS
jgi:hypothetical protein